ncbi:MAG TPA: glycosyltransferase family 39 protein [Polyangiaceae bacterium]|nr:glycosyltransferase family 39 protein [Polyangiaceae bacterium]
MNESSRVRGDAEFGALLFVGALVPRLWLALAWAGEAVWDGHYYDFGARRIAAGFGYSDDRTIDGHVVWHAWCHYPVGYSGFLALFYRVLGASYATAAVANALVGAALALATWALAKQGLRPWRARAAGILVAIHPGLVVYSALVMSEPLAALLTLLAFWLATRDARPWRGLIRGALVLGLAALVRPQALLCAPFLALVLDRSPAAGPLCDPRRSARWTRALGAAALACAVALLPVLPWTARNCRVMDGCALVSTNAGWNLAIGAFPRATGRFETLRSSDGCREVTGQVQQDRCWLSYGLQQIADHPWHWLGLIPAKLGYTFDHESFAVEYLHEAHPEAWPEPRRVLGRAVTTFAHRLLVMAAAFGAIAFPLARRTGGAPRGAPGAVASWAAAVQGGLIAIAGGLAVFAVTADEPTFWPLVIMATIVPWLPLPGAPERPPAIRLATSLLATTMVTHAVFFGEDRYHVVVTPVLAMLAASALRPSAAPRLAPRPWNGETEPRAST